MTAFAHANQPLPLAHGSAPASLRGRTVTVVGLGKSGQAAVELCLARGARVIVADELPESQLPQAGWLRQQGVEPRLGPFTSSLWAGADVVVLSPGVPLAHPAIQAAMAAGIPVVGEVELAMRLLPSTAGPVVGITGTNGKSTTTALTGELFKQSWPRVFVGGNLGLPLSHAAHQEFEAHVVELSSFQLEGVVEARFHGAAILNLAPDHLDRYPSAQAYGAAKARIFLNQKASDYAVVNADDPQVLEWAKAARVPVYGFTLSEGQGLHHLGLAGLAVVEGTGFAFTFGDREHFQLGNRALRGQHNLQNAMAAALLARLAGVGGAQIQAGLDGYGGLPHRLESVRVLEGVEWINDSKATNVDSSLVALRALEGPVWLIAGGKGKGSPYTPLVEASRGKVKGVLVIGADAPAVAAAFKDVCSVYWCGTLEQAVGQARRLAGAGETVLLSPACASYDQFKNFEERGERFKQWVRALT